MVPTFANGDYLIVDEISYRFNEPERGEVIVFRNPTKNKQFLIKRIIGLPGETIAINGDKVTVTKDDTTIQLDEDYINGNFSSYGTWELGAEEYFAMGDNRGKSLDSRSWGNLPKDLIVGKTFLRLFPLATIDFHPGEQEAAEIETII